MKKLVSLLLAFCCILTLLVFPVGAETVSTTATGIIAPPSKTDLTAYVTANGTKTVTDVYNNCLLLTVEGTTGGEWNTYRNLLKNDFKNGAAVLKAMKPKRMLKNELGNEPKGDKTSAWEKRQEEIRNKYQKQ